MAEEAHNSKPASTIEQPERRLMFKKVTRRLGIAVVSSIVGSALLRSRPAPAASVLRPPGALAEKDFQSACVRCGLCVEDCPFDILKLATWADPAPMGTPFFTARDEPCRMCQDIPCVRACPTGALNPLLTDIRKADMGVAVLVDHETCLNYKGLSCSVCVRVCPIRGEAISLRPIQSERGMLQIPTVDSSKCTGCGTCEKHCVLSEAAIRVLPRELGQGVSGANAAGRTPVWK